MQTQWVKIHEDDGENDTVLKYEMVILNIALTVEKLYDSPLWIAAISPASITDSDDRDAENPDHCVVIGSYTNLATALKCAPYHAAKFFESLSAEFLAAYLANKAK
jgi:hypothetical protein